MNQHEKTLITKRNQKRKIRAEETDKERQIRLSRDRERKRRKLESETESQRATRLKSLRERAQKRRKSGKNKENQNPQRQTEHLEQNQKMGAQQQYEGSSNIELTEKDKELLEKFRKKMDNLKNVLCPICNERCPSIVLVQGKCRRCYMEKDLPNKFSSGNNMDPGEVPEELQDLTEIEEMLISKVFTVISVYRLRSSDGK